MVSASTQIGHSGTTGLTEDNDQAAYVVNEHTIGHKSKLRVIFIGAGASGITWHYHARHLDWLDYQIYEKNPSCGGTWFENRYPGARCDVPSLSYQFLFKTNPRWSEFYAGGPEILAYMQETAAELELKRKVKLNSRVSACRFDPAQGKWHVEIIDTLAGTVSHDSADLLVNGSGVLNNWKWPDIRGRESYEGTMLHSACWDTSVDWAGKRIAVIGAGSSGIQMVPELAKTAAAVTSFNRSRTWIVPGLAASLTPDGKGNNFDIPPEEIKRQSDDAHYLLAKRKYVEHEMQTIFKGLIKTSSHQAMMRKLATALMSERLQHDEQLVSQLVPDFAVGCKRPTPGKDYLESFRKPHVSLVTSPIVRFTPSGIETEDGAEHAFDIIACATGFDTSYAPRYTVVGRDTSTTLADDWRDGAKAYLGLAEHGYPNLFFIYGPYAPVAHGSFFPGLDAYVRYILRMAERMAHDKIKTVEVRANVVSDFVQHAQTWLPRAVWTSNCTNWYKKGADGLPIVWPGTMPHALHAMRETRFEHYEYTYLDECAGNAMAWLGNGLDAEELKDGGGHLTGFLDPYIDRAISAVDPKPPQSVALPV